MAVSKYPLGMNARNFLYVHKYNGRKAQKRADDKLETKKVLLKNKIPTPKLITVFHSFRDVRIFDWKSLPQSFVVKPARGSGGEGILVVRKWNGMKGKCVGGKEIDILSLETEIFGLLDGSVSKDNLPDNVFLEERVVVSSSIKKLSSGGVPDVRVIVFRGVPIMAMMRLPTIHAKGKANLHQGALGINVDMRTGITTKASLFGKEVRFIPGTKIKVRGVKIPEWDKVLSIAVHAQEVSGLGYAGIDIVFDSRYGALVLEVNARPGLQIQVVQGDSLRTRLERVEDMKLPNREYAIDLAKRMFAEHALQAIEERSNIVGVVDTVTLIGSKGKKKRVRVKIDTGAYRTSVDRKLVEELEILFSEKKPEIFVISGTTEEVVEREGIDLSFILRGKKIHTIASISEREHLRFPVIIGRRDLHGFLVDPSFRVKEKEKNISEEKNGQEKV